MAEPTKEQSITREQWLENAVEKVRPFFASEKMEIPPVKVSCGFASTTPLKTLGQCWSATCTPDGTQHIFISPIHKNGVEAVGTLVHELVHACLPDDAKHGPMFKDAMKVIGLEGPAKSASPGPALLAIIEGIVEELGDFPNPPLKPKEKTKKDKAASKKSFKVFCPKKRNSEKACRLVETMIGGDYTVTASRKSLKFGFPLCPGCSSEMEMETEDYELYKLLENTPE